MKKNNCFSVAPYLLLFFSHLSILVFHNTSYCSFSLSFFFSKLNLTFALQLYRDIESRYYIEIVERCNKKRQICKRSKGRAITKEGA